VLVGLAPLGFGWYLSLSLIVTSCGFTRFLTERKATPPTCSLGQREDLSGERGGGRLPSNNMSGNRPPPSADFLSKLESVAALPQKDGRVDMDAYSKYKEGGLRRKIHDAIRAKKCIRCFGDGHLRSSCPEGPRSWEDDFNRGKDSFWKPKAKQSRPQWLVPSTHTRTGPGLLFATLRGERVMLDTASDVSLGNFSFLTNLRLAKKTTIVHGVGGKGVFKVEGDLSLDERHFLTLLAVPPSELPLGIVALIGNKHLIEMSVSLDYAQAHPGTPLQDSMAFSSRSLEGETHTGFLSAPLAGSAGISLASGLATGWSMAIETQTFLKFALSLSLSLLVWMVLQWAHPVPLSNTRPPVRDGAVAQAQTSPTDREIRYALSPPCPHRTPRYAGFNTGQKARLDALLRAHSPSYGCHDPGRSSLYRRTALAPPF
jgi:hypothetical protein